MLAGSMGLRAQTSPTINPTMKVLNAEEEPENPAIYSGTAPAEVQFYANVQNADGWTAHYEWHFYEEGKQSEPYLIRYDEDTEYTFLTAGTHYIELYATFTNGSKKTEYTEEYWSYTTPLKVTISESFLSFPNAFSPNDDTKNDVYKAKECRSIVEFHAYIYNRWGQLLYDWTDPEDGWDGTHKGKPVREGVYFCLVKAKGADGRVFNIKKDVNLLRGYTEYSSSATTPGTGE